MNVLKKCSFALAVAAALMAVSASAIGQEPRSTAAKLSDAELDLITAGNGAMSEVLIFNSGEGPGEPKINRNHVTCINCDALLPEGIVPPRPSGMVNVLTGSGKVVSHFIHQRPF